MHQKPKARKGKLLRLLSVRSLGARGLLHPSARSGAAERGAHAAPHSSAAFSYSFPAGPTGPLLGAASW
jgi:hypothetical protein